MSEETAGVLDVDTAFIVFIKDGVPYATNALGDTIITHEGTAKLLELDHHADPIEMQRGATEVVDDIRRMRDTQAVVTNVMHNLAALGAQKQRADEDQRLAQAVQSGKLHVPGAK